MLRYINVPNVLKLGLEVPCQDNLFPDCMETQDLIIRT